MVAIVVPVLPCKFQTLTLTLTQPWTGHVSRTSYHVTGSPLARCSKKSQCQGLSVLQELVKMVQAKKGEKSS